MAAGATAVAVDDWKDDDILDWNILRAFRWRNCEAMRSKLPTDASRRVSDDTLTSPSPLKRSTGSVSFLSGEQGPLLPLLLCGKYSPSLSLRREGKPEEWKEERKKEEKV